MDDVSGDGVETSGGDSLLSSLSSNFRMQKRRRRSLGTRMTKSQI
jgi:hypothetical protein